MKTKRTTTVFAITLLLVFTPFFSNAQEKEPTVTLEFENAEAALQTVKNYINALQKGDVDTMNAQLDDNAMIYGLGGGLDSLNVSQHKAYYTNSTNTFTHSISKDLYLPTKVENNWNEGEWILCWGTNTVTDKKTGTKIPIPYHTANRIVNGKIVFIRYFYDMLNIWESQGFTLTPPKE